MQVTCRDRNRMALQSDLLSAGALGIPNVLLLTGDHPRYGDHPDAMPVFDLDGVQSTWTARTLRDEGELLSGASSSRAARLAHRVGGEPVRAGRRLPRAAARKKFAAGAEFAGPSTCSTSTGSPLDRRRPGPRAPGALRVLAGVGPVRSLRVLEYLRTGVPGIHVPDTSNAGCAASRRTAWPPRASGVCVETIEALREVPGRGRRAPHGVRLRTRRPRHPRRGRVLAGPRPAHDAPTRALSAVPGEG